MPKRENFLLAFFALSAPSCRYVTYGLEKINFLSIYPWFCWFLWLLVWVCNKPKKFEASPKLKDGGGCFWVHMYCILTICFLKNCKVLFFYECLKVLRRVHFFSEHSVCGQNFLLPTQYAITFSAYSACLTKIFAK